MSNTKEGVFEMPVMSIKDLKDFAERFEKYQIQKDSHIQNDVANASSGESENKDRNEEVVEVNGSQVRVGTTEHINAMLGKTSRKNSKQSLLNSTHTDLFSEDFVSTPDSLFESESPAPEEKQAPSQTNGSIYSAFNDVSVSESEKYLQLKVADKDNNVFGINLPVVDDGKSLVALNVCNVENLSGVDDQALDNKMEELTQLVDKIHSDSISEGRKSWKPIYGAFEADFSSAISELAEMDEYQKNDKPMILFSEGCDNDNGYKVAIQPNSPLAKKWDKQWGNQHDSEIANKDVPKFGIQLKTMTTRSLGEDDKHPIVLFGTSEYENGKNSFHSEMSLNVLKYMKGDLDDEQAFVPQENPHRRKTPVVEKEPSVGFDI
jgi:hypothetical protein